MVSAAFTYLDFPQGTIPVYGKAASTLLALVIIYFGSRRLWKRRARAIPAAARTYEARTPLDRELYNKMMVRMQQRGHKAVAPYLREIIGEDVRNL